jgi:hypothetical protein
MNDSTPYNAKVCCIDENKFIWKEVDIIKPRRIIFYTHYYYDDFIERFRPQYQLRFKDLTDRQFRISVGGKTSLYWHRDFFDANENIICSFLRVSHPMMKNREDFIEAIVDWLRQTE